MPYLVDSVIIVAFLALVVIILAVVPSPAQEVHFPAEIDQLRLQVRQMCGVFHMRR